MIKVLEMLEEKYPNTAPVEDLMKRTKLKDVDGEISKILRYLKEKNKIEIIFPETKMGHKTGRYNLDKWLMIIDEIKIKPDGIDYLYSLKEVKATNKRNELSLDSTIVLTQIAIIGIVITLWSKLNLGLYFVNPLPFLVSLILLFVLTAFFMLLIYKILVILFNIESWRNIFFPD